MESEEDMRAMTGSFFEVYKRRVLYVKTDKSKRMVLGGDEGLVCEIPMEEREFEQVFQFKYLISVR